MIESGKSLSYSKNYCSVLEKIVRSNDIKQNEKHPLIYIYLSLPESYIHLNTTNMVLCGKTYFYINFVLTYRVQSCHQKSYDLIV